MKSRLGPKSVREKRLGIESRLGKVATIADKVPDKGQTMTIQPIKKAKNSPERYEKAHYESLPTYS